MVDVARANMFGFPVGTFRWVHQPVGSGPRPSLHTTKKQARCGLVR